MKTFDLAFEITGIIAFAISGALVGIRRRMDIFGVMVLGLITAVGGGIMRDVILGITPPAAFCNPVYAGVALAVSILTYIIFTSRLWGTGGKGFSFAVTLADAIGLALFTVHGAGTAITAGYGDNIFLVLFLGVLTGVGGGILRDVLSARRPVIFCEEIYAVAAFIGAVIYVCIYKYLGVGTSSLICCTVIVTLRMLSVHFGWRLPKANRK